MNRALFGALVACGLSASSAMAAPMSFTLNKDHTDVVFEISHLGFSNKHGWFRDMSGVLILDPDRPSNSSVDVTIKSNSVDTNHAGRDKDLAGPAFLDVAKFPDMHFVSTSVIMTGTKTADINGNLTLHGTTRPLILHAKLNRIGLNPLDHRNTAGFTARASLKRSDFGISTYLPMIGDDIDITFDAEFSASGS